MKVRVACLSTGGLQELITASLFLTVGKIKLPPLKILSVPAALKY